MKKSTASLLMLVLVVFAGGLYYVASQTSLRPTGGRQVVIEMTTRAWRFDVVSVAPSDGASFSAKPSTGPFADLSITVRRGDVIVLQIRNLDIPHGFELREYGIEVQTPPGQVTTIKFLADKAGVFIFRCNVFCGEGHPMHTGTLVVQG